ncbi:DEAD/DEAH box helicase [Azospirillum sp. 412522]|nr:DEAD/DEAH box helicase family protein [Azospirillum sp. 412522]MBY6260840.1 DEAD/DEAH box helicase [Azospirillum sp. 412522]
MKLHFDANLPHQAAAIEAVRDLFRGQEVARTEFTVIGGAQGSLAFSDDTGLGVGNRLQLLDDELLRNLRDIQVRNGLRPSDSLASGDFTVEMETGTGKTYVYLRTIFELNKHYGFTKFVIVVPSIAIKEGVFKTLQITEEHFRAHYAGVNVEYFLYDSSKLGQVRNFATSPNIQIMIVTVGAINKKDVNNLYKDQEGTGGERPIDLIKATRPIVIVDEPQSVDGGLSGAGKGALGEMKPLCTLRYSATHADKHHMVFRLDAVDAYERKLVKQIAVAAAEVEGAHNKPYIRLVSTANKRNVITASVELDVLQNGHVRRQTVTVQDGDDLQQTTGRDIYAHHRVGEILCTKGKERVEIRRPGGEDWLVPGQAINDVDADALKRLMIRRTIVAHLRKEQRLRPLGIKVLSLFFVDQVEHYRWYDADGGRQKGKYALMFEEEYRRAARSPDFESLFKEVDLETEAADVHDGYFSIDKTGKRWTDTEDGNQAGRDAAERAYNLIMKEKEKLLSFDTKLKFIFSHSALREGWDNPNVFQICALRDIQTERERRQTIGRGLRLCVNQEGERVHGFEINTLTVVSTEGYREFAENLQREIEADTGIRFGVVERHQFAAIPIMDEAGRTAPLGVDSSEAIWAHLRATGYVDAKGKVQDTLRTALKEGTVDLPPAAAPHRAQVEEILRKLAGGLDVKNADDDHPVRARKEVLADPKFQALWDRIKHKTTYRVQFDNERLVADCVRALRDSAPITRPRVTFRNADLAIGRGGVTANETAVSASMTIDETDIELPDILTELQDRTQLTRRSLVRILQESERLGDFARNPQQFIELATEAINRAKRLALVDGIRYRRLGDDHVYAQELFQERELVGYLKSMLPVTKSVYDYVIYDSSGVERVFAEQLEKDETVKVYAKLPNWFKVPTPLGTYNPDWAVLIEEDGQERLYFVVETKGSLFTDDLRDKESAKIACGRAHFKALAVDESPADFIHVRNIDDFKREIVKRRE